MAHGHSTSAVTSSSRSGSISARPPSSPRRGLHLRQDRLAPRLEVGHHPALGFQQRRVGGGFGEIQGLRMMEPVAAGFAPGPHAHESRPPPRHHPASGPPSAPGARTPRPTRPSAYAWGWAGPPAPPPPRQGSARRHPCPVPRDDAPARRPCRFRDAADPPPRRRRSLQNPKPPWWDCRRHRTPRPAQARAAPGPGRPVAPARPGTAAPGAGARQRPAASPPRSPPPPAPPPPSRQRHPAGP
jgi:hypothetical protein